MKYYKVTAKFQRISNKPQCDPNAPKEWEESERCLEVWARSSSQAKKWFKQQFRLTEPTAKDVKLEWVLLKDSKECPKSEDRKEM